MLQALFAKPNSLLKPLKKKGFKEARVTTIGLYDIGKSHDPGIQQEPCSVASHNGSVSNVEMGTPIALTYKVLFPSISTFETLPAKFWVNGSQDALLSLLA
jgi:hypothetical protein